MGKQIILTMQDGTTSKPFDEDKLSSVLEKLASTKHKVTGIANAGDISEGKKYSQDQDLESTPSAIINGALQGISGGFLDEGAAGVRALKENAPDALAWLAKHPNDDVPFDEAKKKMSESMDKNLAAGRAKRDLAANANPVAYEAADALSGLAAAALLGSRAGKPGMAAFGALSTLGHDDTKDVGTAIKSAGVGALSALVPGIGKRLSGMIPAAGTIGGLEEFIKKPSLTGAALGLVMHKLGPLAEVVVSKVSPKLGVAIAGLSGASEDALSKPAKLTEAQKAELYQAIAETLSEAKEQDPNEKEPDSDSDD